MEYLWQTIGCLATAIISGFASWFFTRRKYNAEVKGAEVQNFDAAIDAYKKMYEDMITELKEQNADLKSKVASLEKELDENRKQIVTLTNFVLADALKKADAIHDTNDITALKTILK